jgi:hypothetical protein
MASGQEVDQRQHQLSEECRLVFNEQTKFVVSPEPNMFLGMIHPIYKDDYIYPRVY